MSSLNPIWLADAELPSEIVNIRYETIQTTTGLRETNIRIQFAPGVKQVRGMELAASLIPKLGPTRVRESAHSEDDFAYSQYPILTLRIVDKALPPEP